jgi:hypothetical protein
VCIPAGIEQQTASDKMIANMMQLITRLENMKAKQ